MSDATYLGAVTQFAYAKYYDPSFREGLVLFMEAIDEIAPQVGKSYWDAFVQIDAHPKPDFGSYDSGPYFDEEEFLVWLGKFHLDRWNHGLPGTGDRPPQDFVVPFAYMWETFFTVLGAEIDGEEGPDDDALEECLKNRSLGPVFRSWYAPEQSALHLQWMLANWKRDPTPEFVSASVRMAPVYNPVFDSRQEFRKKTEQYMKEVEQMALQEGVKKAPRMNLPRRDFGFLVRRVVLDQTAEDIAQQLIIEDPIGDKDPFDKVQKAIQRSAQLIGLRVPAGRPSGRSTA